MGEGEGGGGHEFFIPLPFTLLDKFFNGPSSLTDVLSNRVNPLPPGEGRLLGVLKKKLEKNSQI